LYIRQTCIRQTWLGDPRSKVAWSRWNSNPQIPSLMPWSWPRWPLLYCLSFLHFTTGKSLDPKFIAWKRYFQFAFYCPVSALQSLICSKRAENSYVEGYIIGKNPKLRVIIIINFKGLIHEIRKHLCDCVTKQ